MHNAELDLLGETVFNEISDSEPKLLSNIIQFRKRAFQSLEEQPVGRLVEAIFEFVCNETNGGSRSKVALGKMLNSSGLSSLPWTLQTPKNSRARRDLIYQRLGIENLTIHGARVQELIENNVTRVFDPDEISVTIQAQGHEPWYSENRKIQRFHWENYRRFQQEKFAARGFGLDDDALIRLDLASDEIVGLLADPSQETIFNAKGLVVGYVQSGKTTNFSAVIAKAVDAGYKIIIVFAGLTNMLRGQTQQRLDKELLGWEAVHSDPEYLRQFRDASPGKLEFLQLGKSPRDILESAPDWVRLTHAERRRDYQSLATGLKTLHFKHHKKSLPLSHPENLANIDVIFLVVKKNPTVLTKLINDIKSAESSFTKFRRDLPVLIIDDEADQASINSLNPKSQQAAKLRTKTNEKITDLLDLFGRGQYLAYTATPFANVFIDADDPKDLFPKDFIVSLDRPKNYVGGREFVDLDPEAAESNADLKTSNQRAFVRDIDSENHRDALKEAIRSFVIGGAIKIYREQKLNTTFQHHTMLVHTVHIVNDIKAMRENIVGMWKELKFSTSGMKELERLWNEDFSPVSKARGDGLPSPVTFKELQPFLAKALQKIESSGIDSIAISVHYGEDQDKKNEIDFDGRELNGEKKSIWKIICGGNKLSRGFTIEGLTISYFRRTANTDDTRMQMARWFGYRPNYQDLVRLYIGRNEGKNQNIDIYDQFRDMCLQEEHFRSQLRLYAFNNDIGKRLTPRKIPPLVQAISGSSPTGKNKMWHARIVAYGGGSAWWEPLKSYHEKRKSYDKSNHNLNLIANFMANSEKINARAKALDPASYPNAHSFSDLLLCKEGKISDLMSLLHDFKFSDEAATIEKAQRIQAIENGGLTHNKVIFLLHTGLLKGQAKLKIADTEIRPFGRSILDENETDRFKALTVPHHKAIANLLTKDPDEQNKYRGSGFLEEKANELNVVVLIYVVERMDAQKNYLGDLHGGLAIRFPESIYSNLVYQNASATDVLVVKKEAESKVKPTKAKPTKTKTTKTKPTKAKPTKAKPTKAKTTKAKTTKAKTTKAKTTKV